jgi:ABC-type transporter Mla maintaining outer membrane lipid asymmetry permease subunit MlaE
MMDLIAGMIGILILFAIVYFMGIPGGILPSLVILGVSVFTAQMAWWTWRKRRKPR